MSRLPDVVYLLLSLVFFCQLAGSLTLVTQIHRNVHIQTDTCYIEKADKEEADLISLIKEREERERDRPQL